ncbi:MAG: hypothetical protein FJ303_18940 [Planctomycetes bacterium]|nr:hypothetical protein [Planctomycetota bacterium]
MVSVRKPFRQTGSRQRRRSSTTIPSWSEIASRTPGTACVVIIQEASLISQRL